MAVPPAGTIIVYIGIEATHVHSIGTTQLDLMQLPFRMRSFRQSFRFGNQNPNGKEIKL
jgi:hypothetical protein